MTPDEARTLLDMVRMIDNKIGEPDDARATLWAEVLGDMPLKKALAGMKEHYRTSAETIMPSHIRAAADRVWNAWEAKERSQIARTAPQIEARSTVGLTESERVQRARERQHSPIVAAALAEARAKMAPGRPGALKISGSIGGPRDRGAGGESPRGRDPQRLGGLLRLVSSEIKSGTNEAAA